MRFEIYNLGEPILTLTLNSNERVEDLLEQIETNINIKRYEYSLRWHKLYLDKPDLMLSTYGFYDITLLEIEPRLSIKGLFKSFYNGIGKSKYHRFGNTS